MNESLSQLNTVTALTYEFYVLAKNINNAARYKIFLAFVTGIAIANTLWLVCWRYF